MAAWVPLALFLFLLCLSSPMGARSEALGANETWLSRALSAPNPCGHEQHHWRQKEGKHWRPSDFRCAYASARQSASLRSLLHERVRDWVRLLTLRLSSSRYWLGGKLPTSPLRHVCPANFTDFAGRQSQASCDTFWPRPADRPCVAFIIGIGGIWEYAETALLHGCRVHAFDPTEELRAAHEAGANKLGEKVTFHFVGLGGDSSQNQHTTAQAYGHLRNDMRSLDELVHLAAKASASQSSSAPMDAMPDVLSIDCEGCEWAALEKVAKSSSEVLHRVRLLTLEVHVSPTMQPPTPEQLVNVFDLLFITHGFRLWWAGVNKGWPFDWKAVDYLAFAGLPHDTCCYELAFVKPEALH